MLGDYRGAEDRLQESLAVARDSDYRFAMGLALDGLGQVAFTEGRYVEAQAFFSDSTSLFRDMGGPHRLSRVLDHRGQNSLALGDRSHAHDDFQAALRLAYDGGLLPSVLSALTGLAALEAGQNANQEALERVLYVLRHPASPQETKDRAARLRTKLESGLPQAAVEAAQRRVPSMDLGEVVRQAIANT